MANPLRLLSSIAAFACCAALTVHTAAAAGLDRYRGACDASAAIALDDRYFVVGEDENDTLLIYEFGQPEPKGRVPLSDYLGNKRPNGKIKEGDIEGSARIGTVVYWITSHGRDSKGNKEPERQRLFATELVKDGDRPSLRGTGVPYAGLLADLLSSPKLENLGLEAGSKLAPEAVGGLNIEGLASTKEGYLLIGFRNPVVRGRAIVVPITNPSAIVMGTEHAQIGTPVLLDLGNRGIRSIEALGDEFIIAAGPSGEVSAKAGGDFAMFIWDGRSGSARQLNISVGTLVPEGMFIKPGTNELVLLSDDGDQLVGNNLCKNAAEAEKSFRLLTTTIP